MTYVQLAAAITLASFTVILSSASVVSALIAPAITRVGDTQAPASRAAGLFALRLLPWTAALFGSFGIVLPMFLWFEPSDTQEPIAKTLAIIGVGGLAWLVSGAWRAAGAWRATRALARDWRARGRPVDTRDAPVPVFAIDETYPMVAVVGFRRPTLFISERVLRTCSPDEVRAMILHECAHVASRDNMKRFLLRACPELVAANRRLDTLWAHATEEAADAAVAGGRPALRIDLAQALVRVAQLATAARGPLPASALYLGGSIESRVRRLLDPAEPLAITTMPIWAIAGAVAVVMLVVAVAFGRDVHGAIETVITRLP